MNIVKEIARLKKKKNAIVLVHNYQRPEVQALADFLGDSLGLVKEAGCPMADMITAEELRSLKEKYPDAKVVSYVNTNADVKAESDVCCTSANAVKVVKNIDAERIIFTPDKNLASYCQRFVDKKLIPWDGYCYVHESITKEEVLLAKEKFPDACLLVHPECNPAVIDVADEVLSTGQMVLALA
jgi:quinolinate synthase